MASAQSQESLNQLLLKNTSQTILFNVQEEFSKLLEQLDGNEDLKDVAKYFFEEGFRRLSSKNEYIMGDLIEVLSKVFMDLATNFTVYADVEVTRDYNIGIKVGQLIRFFNFIQSIANSNNKKREIESLINHITEIKKFIFNNHFTKKPHQEDWSTEFKNLERISNSKKIGYETYYAAGVLEIIRTISNKKRHPKAFPKKFNTQFNFYNDFHQMIGVYNLALYSFIELIEAWVSVKLYIDTLD